MADTKTEFKLDSESRVAFDLMNRVLYFEGNKAVMNRKDVLDLYAECLYAARGLRDISNK